MSTQRHTIGKLIVELHIDSRDEAWDMQNEVSASYQRLFLEELERIFDEMVGPDEVLVINRLEIDAGQMDRLDEIPQQLRARVYEALQRMVYEARSSDDGNAEVTVSSEEGGLIRTQVSLRRREEDDFGKLHYFLTYGFLPGVASKESIRSIAERLLEKSPEAWVQLLPRLPDKRRLVAQLGEHFLQRLLPLVQPHSSALLAIHERVLRLAPQVPRAQLWAAAFSFSAAAAIGEYLPHLVQQLPEAQRTILQQQLAQEAKPLSSSQEETVSQETAQELAQLNAVREELQRLLSAMPGARNEIFAIAATLADQLEALLQLPANDQRRQTLEQLVNAARILSQEKEDTPQVQKFGVRLALQRLSGELMQRLDRANGEAELHVQLEKLQQALQKNIEEERRKAEQQELPPEAAEGLYIRNAGLILLWPYLEAFFSNLGLTEDDQFIDEEARVRAAHLLQFLATGVFEETEEQELLLNKILCGMEATDPLPLIAELEESELDECEDLVQALIRNWEALKRTSVPGLQEAFMRREGKLVRGEEDWSMTVERASADMLFETLPYSIAQIQLPWMKLPLYVEW